MKSRDEQVLRDAARALAESERERLERARRRHELGHPAVTEVEIAGTTHRVVQDVQPVDTDGVRTMIVGTAVWGIAAIALIPFLGTLNDAGRAWWLWTAVAGFGLGLIGIEYCRHRRDALRFQPGRRRSK